MMGRMKVGSTNIGTSTQLGGGQTVWTPPPGAHPMSVLLFGKRAPKRVDRRKHPKLGKSLKKLEYVKDQISEMLGRSGEELSLELCEGKNAFINRDGQISFGVELLERHGSDDDLMVAVLGHEIGHQPWTWPEYLDPRGMTKAKLDAIYREEEAKADRFAGLVLAELGAKPDSLCEFLRANEAFEARKPTDYYPAETRAEIIRGAFQRRGRALELKKRDLLGNARATIRELR
jgi:hypothetical protein